MSKIGQPELGYLPLNFFNFSHFRGVATITRANIIRSVSNFGNRKVSRKYRSRSNMSKISQPELGYLPLNFFNFSHFRVFNSNKYHPICFRNSKYYPICYKLLQNTGQGNTGQINEQNRSTRTGLSALEMTNSHENCKQLHFNEKHDQVHF